MEARENLGVHFKHKLEFTTYNTLLYSSRNTYVERKKRIVLFNDAPIWYDCISGFYMNEVRMWNNRRMILTEADRSTARKFPHIVTLTTKHPKSTFT